MKHKIQDNSSLSEDFYPTVRNHVSEDVSNSWHIRGQVSKNYVLLETTNLILSIRGWDALESTIHQNPV